MNLSEILGNEELRQHEFPVCKEKVFLAHAAVCPLPRRVTDAMSRYLTECNRGDQEEVLPEREILETRKVLAKMINAQPQEIALVGPTSLALSYVASGWPISKGDNIVVYFDDYPSNVYPWMALAEKGVQIRLLHVRELGRINAADILSQVDEQTRLVALASCHFISGYRLDLKEVSAELRERGVPFCVDGIQTLGAFPMNAAHFDFMAADAHKWLLGPCAAGVMYVRHELQDQLRPSTYGWHNVRCPNYVAQEQLNYPFDARRYEAGSHNLVGLVGLRAAAELLLEVGIEPIAAELLRKRKWVIPALQKKGYVVLQPEGVGVHAGAIISFFKPQTDLPAVHQKLSENSIVASLRTDRQGQRYIRLSPHFYNTDAELHRVLELL